MKRGFTLIELLVVIAIIAILAVVVVLTLNPAELLRQSRDANRLSDISTLTNAVNLYNTDQSGASTFSLGNASSEYLSVPDTTLTTNQTSTCSALGMATLPAGDTWNCGASQGYRNIGVSGWIPIQFSNMSSGAPISSLPVDPTNQSSSGLFYSYSGSGGQFAVTATLESTKYKTQFLSSPEDSFYPELIIGGTPSSSIIFNPNGLVGWWPLTEGTSTTAYDKSNNGNNGSWQGGAVGTNGYYSGGKIGAWSGAFDGSSTYINTGANSFPTGNNPTSVFAWIYYTGGTNWKIIQGYGPWSCPMPNFGLFNGQLTYDYACGGSAYFESGLYPTPNTWVFIGYSYTGGGGTSITMYMNNTSSTGPLGSSQNASLSGGGRIGSADGSPNYYFPGLIDDVRLYNRALSPAEVQALYTSGN